jgi:hypothetical protein
MYVGWPTNIRRHGCHIGQPAYVRRLMCQEATQKLVSNNFNSYVCIVYFIHVKLTFVQDRYMEELRKTHGPDADPRLVPFDVNAAYHAGGGLLHGRYVESH